MSRFDTISPASDQGVTAVLGPTNTGKTHLAIERMLGHASGMIGLPLRLLAREVYDKVAIRCGQDRVALITGEEKIVPDQPDYYVCTVEAMPLDIAVDFLAVDEVQLAADLERGHVFTHRLLHARGNQETMLLGASTMRKTIRKLLPGANFVSRPRFSQLTYSGTAKISRLARRSAVVAFSADNVYSIAELIRRQRGGAAVVMGALSPRTRNAQVGLYQSGDVDFLVATDAIGMGLNMDIDHVSFAATRKFDGRRHRDLSAAELAQIAGRAGRHMNDGTFGETSDASPLGDEIVSNIESHDFAPVKLLQWRNADPDFGSVDALIESLYARPDSASLVRAPVSADLAALESLARDKKIMENASTSETVRLLWDVCQLPDYRNIAAADHSGLIGKLYRFLTDEGHIPADWFEAQVVRADNMQGDIDTLAGRISYIRTWTFVANRPDWLSQAKTWREATRDIEDRLSDALHERLTRRFVDRRTSVLMKNLREKEELMAAVTSEGEIIVEGELVGHLQGFCFVPESHGGDIHAKALRTAAVRALDAEIPERAARLAAAKDDAFTLDGGARILWEENAVAILKPGGNILKPSIEIIAGEHLTGNDRESVTTRLAKWIEEHIAGQLEPLINIQNASDVTGLGRGLAFRLVENLGMLEREKVVEDVRALDQEARGQLRQYGVRFGAFSIYVPVLLKPAAAKTRRLLWALGQGGKAIDDMPEPPGEGLTSVARDASLPDGFYEASGFRVCGTRAVRVDMLERLADEIRPLVYWKPGKEGDERPEGSVEGGGFTVTPSMMSYVGCSGDDFAQILRALGFSVTRRTRKIIDEEAPEEEQFDEIWRPKKVRPQMRGRKGKKPQKAKSGSRPPGKDKKPARKKPEKAPDPDSPFAALKELKLK